MDLRKLALFGVSGVAGLSLIGVGAHATFTQDTVSSQQISSGHMNVVLAEGSGVGSGPTVTLAPVGPVGSSFTTGDTLLTITNTGDIPVNEITSTPSDIVGAGTGSAALAAQAYLCETSSGTVIYNGPLSGAPAQAIAGTLAPHATDNYTVNVYAGTETTACGSGTSGQANTGPSTAPSLTNAAQGGTITPTLTVSYTG